MNIKEATEALNSFFLDKDQKVLVLKGPWGSGKSYFVRSYLSDQNSRAPNYQFFVSLFGLNSLSEVRENINSSLHIKDGEDKVAAGILTISRHLKNAKVAGKGLVDGLGLKQAGGLATAVGDLGTSLFFSYVKTQPSVVVFDDLERTDTPAHIILGLTSSLAENTRAKVVIILNEGELEKDAARDLARYREKVVSSEILFKPRIRDIVHKFLDEKEISDEISSLFSRLNSSNIRLLYKINTHLSQFRKLSEKHGLEVSKDEIVRVAKIAVLHYLSESPVTVDQIAAGFFASSLKGDTVSKSEKQLQELAKLIQMFPTYPLDGLSLELIQNGFCSDESVEKAMTHYRTNKSRDSFTSDLRRAYAKYGDNFIGTKNEVVRDLKAFLDRHASAMSTEQLVGHLNFLKVLGYSKSFEQWKGAHRTVLNTYGSLEMRVAGARLLLPSKIIRVYISECNRENRKSRPDVISIMRRVTKSQSWNPEDVDAFNSYSEKQFIQLITCCQETDFTDLLRGIKRMWSSYQPAESFSTKLNAALINVASRSMLNRVRVKNLFDL